MKKYRYVSASGLFLKTKEGKYKNYTVNIPHKRLYNTEKEAIKDSRIAFRFIKTPEQTLLLGYEDGEKCECDLNDNFKVKLQGNSNLYYTEQEFKKNGGKIFNLVEKEKGWFEEGEEVQDTWDNIFADENYYKLIYVDDEAYCIEEVNDKSEEISS